MLVLPASAQSQPATPKRKLKVIYYQPKAHLKNATRAQLAKGFAGNTTTIALWNYNTNQAYDGNFYSGTMVGRSPFANGHRTTTIPTFIQPIKLVFSGDSSTYDPTAVNSCIGNDTPVDLMKKSPIFQSHAWTLNGQNVGSTQYLDAFQRANFWALVQGTPYHTVFSSSPTVLPLVTLSVPSASSSLICPANACGNTCATATLEGMDVSFFDNYVFNTLLPGLASQGVGPTNFPQIVLSDVVMYQGDPTQCCILGFHNSGTTGTGAFQTYSVNDLDIGGFFGLGYMSTMSHEVAEWMDDPSGGNGTPPWGAEGQVPSPNCQANLEVGDPLSGTDLPQVTMNGFTYNLQELAFYSWFIGDTPASLGAGGKFSDNGTFGGHAILCPPGGSN